MFVTFQSMESMRAAEICPLHGVNNINAGNRKFKVKFSEDKDLEDEECRRLLSDCFSMYLDSSVQDLKIMQKQFVKYASLLMHGHMNNYHWLFQIYEKTMQILR